MNNDSFDERQKLIRYKIFSSMYFVLIVYFLIWGTIDVFIDIKFATMFQIIMTGITLTGTVSVILMIFKECYLGRFDSKKLMTACMLCFILLIVYNVKTLIEKGGIVSNGKLNDNYIMFCISFMWGVITLSFFIKEISNHKKSKTSKEE